ncbi:hypothetical protein CVT25_009692 [Psilocybe cyanescens]|uniref:Uncharacterized protein n=1 Tax=Psilocybe cyanescens TaxID=93625 RepID=A0A409XP22_PSICY|nr:hypothetical protein CVT25_009692 [Psilocybe cyanescens]
MSETSTAAGTLDPFLSLYITGIRDIQIIRYARLGDPSVFEIEPDFTDIYAVLTLNRECFQLRPEVNDSIRSHHAHLGLHYFRWEGWTGIIGYIFTSGLLQTRIFALYSMNKAVVAFLSTFFVLSLASAATIMGVFLSGITGALEVSFNTIARYLEYSFFVGLQAHALPVPGGSFCSSSQVPSYLYSVWIPILIFESVLCAMAVMRGFQNRAATRYYYGQSRLLDILVLDSIRIYALYELNKRILALTLGLFMITSGISIWIMATSSLGLTARAVNIPGARFCNMSVFPPTTYTFWIPILVFESLLCTLAIIQGFRTFKYHGSLFSHGNRLMGILVRDSVTYYLLCIIVGFKTPVFSLCNL